MQEITKATLGALWTLQTQRFEWDWRDFQYLAEVVRHLAAKELEAATAPVSTPWTPGRQALVAHLPVETIQALEEWLTERLATASASSESSPNTTGPMERLTGSPGAGPGSPQEP